MNMKRSLLALILVVLCWLPAIAQDDAPDAAKGELCDRDRIVRVASNGKLLEMLSGEVFRVNDADTRETARWLPLDVLTCQDSRRFFEYRGNGGFKAPRGMWAGPGPWSKDESGWGVPPGWGDPPGTIYSIVIVAPPLNGTMTNGTIALSKPVTARRLR